LEKAANAHAEVRPCT